MNHSLIEQGSRTQLVKQLLYFDEEKISFLNQYFPDHDKKRTLADGLLTRYCAALENVLSDFTEEKLHSVVLIGSRLKLHDVADSSSEFYTIVFPAYADPFDNKISLLSPIGMQLLMAERDNVYQLEVPSGEISVIIEDISYVNHGEPDLTTN